MSGSTGAFERAPNSSCSKEEQRCGGDRGESRKSKSHCQCATIAAASSNINSAHHFPSEAVYLALYVVGRRFRRPGGVATVAATPNSASITNFVKSRSKVNSWWSGSVAFANSFRRVCPVQFYSGPPPTLVAAGALCTVPSSGICVETSHVYCVAGFSSVHYSDSALTSTFSQSDCRPSSDAKQDIVDVQAVCCHALF